MIRIVRAWRVVSPGFGPGDVSVRSRHADKETADREAERLNRSDCAAVAWFRAEPFYALEVQAERGGPLFFDLGSPVELR